jgi:lysophospholipase L1-like esterase
MRAPRSLPLPSPTLLLAFLSLILALAALSACESTLSASPGDGGPDAPHDGGGDGLAKPGDGPANPGDGSPADTPQDGRSHDGPAADQTGPTPDLGRDSVKTPDLGPDAPTGPVSIMCLGDSISEGISTATTYRSYLYKALVAAGKKVDFVGVNRGTCGNINAGVQGGWDGDHCAFYSAKASQILGGNMPVNSCSPAGSGNIKAWAPAFKPDLAIIHLGTNDCRGGATPAQIQGSLAGIIGHLRAANPQVKLVVAQIITNRDATANARVKAFNATIPAWAAGLSTATSPLVVVDQASGWDTKAHLRDDFHPNATGAQRMAQRFLTAVQGLLP